MKSARLRAFAAAAATAVSEIAANLGWWSATGTLRIPGAGYSRKMCAPPIPASALRVSTTSGARRVSSA